MFHQSKTRLIWSGLLAAAIACTAMANASAAGPSNVAPWIKNATLIGAAPANRSVTIAVHLSLNNTAGLKALVAEVSSPSSRQYGRYLTPAEFGQRFAPESTGVNAVKAMLEHAGMTDIQVGPHGVYVSAVATVAQLRSDLPCEPEHVRLQGHDPARQQGGAHPSRRAGRESPVRRGPGRHDIAPATLSSLGHHGQRSSRRPRQPPPTAVTPPPVAAGNGSPYCNHYFGAGALVAKLSTAADVYGAAIPWLACGYTPQQIQAAYGLNKVTKYNGKGVTVAIVDAYASPTLMADANRYAANHDLPKLKTGVNFSQIIPLGIYDVSPTEACGPYGWWEEQSLDMAAVHGARAGRQHRLRRLAGLQHFARHRLLQHALQPCCRRRHRQLGQ